MELEKKLHIDLGLVEQELFMFPKGVAGIVLNYIELLYSMLHQNYRFFFAITLDRKTVHIIDNINRDVLAKISIDDGHIINIVFGWCVQIESFVIMTDTNVIYICRYCFDDNSINVTKMENIKSVWSDNLRFIVLSLDGDAMYVDYTTNDTMIVYKKNVSTIEIVYTLFNISTAYLTHDGKIFVDNVHNGCNNSTSLEMCDIKSIYKNGNLFVAMRTNNEAIVWDICLGDRKHNNITISIDEGDDVKLIEKTRDYCILVTGNGKVLIWKWNEQLVTDVTERMNGRTIKDTIYTITGPMFITGDNDIIPSEYVVNGIGNAMIDTKDIKMEKIIANSKVFFGLDTNGKVHMLGDPSIYKQLDDETVAYINNDIIDIYISDFGFVAIKNNNTLIAWTDSTKQTIDTLSVPIKNIISDNDHFAIMYNNRQIQQFTLG
jgi:hypothetical protein